MSTRNRFVEWVEEQLATGETRTSVASKLGCHPSHLGRLMRTPDAEHPSRLPDLTVAAKIEEFSEAWVGGVIRARDWLKADERIATAAVGRKSSRAVALCQDEASKSGEKLRVRRRHEKTLPARTSARERRS